jgi:cell division protein FtsI/penicillin-binding protein 2
MSGRQGSVVVLDAQSGRLLAQHRLEAAARRLSSPGSVIKPFVLAALIDASIVTASTRHQCQRVLRTSSRNLDCSHVKAGESLDAVTALAYSCNTYFARFATRVQAADLVRTLTSFGLTSRTNLAPSEVTGTITPPADLDSLQLLALGEGGVSITVLALAAAYRRLALLKRERNARSTELALVLDGLSAAAQYGTARLATPASIRIAGKTGTATAQAGARHHAWFAGYAPAERPEAIVVVFLEGGSGGGDAAPVARQIFESL